MERDMNQQQATTLCKGGCGFFGSAATEGLCSKCFKDSLKRKQDTARLSPTSLAPIASSSSSNVDSQQASTSTNGSDKLREIISTPMPTTCSSEGVGGSSAAEMQVGETTGMLATSGDTVIDDTDMIDSLLLAANGSVDDIDDTTSSFSATASSSIGSVGTGSAMLLQQPSPMTTDTVVIGTGGDTIGINTVKKPNRCHTCKKRVGLTGFTCRCGGMFCGEHRYTTAHACNFDYKTMEREELRKNNPVIVSEKIQRI